MSREVGSAAEEAARLFAALEEWARARAGSFVDDEHLATGSAECRVCPVCQAIGALRHVRPEAVEHLLDAAASLVAALRATATTPAGEEQPRAPRVERIDVSEV
ncbi:MAG TPA: hypothetical protein VNU26_05205 [Mycobacteriales bacterium]|nr:hypothetical protein [Mycobacteriales bacterium]